ncbi:MULTISPECIES: UDP-N-acetylmuramoyl-L-alanyl-D-glutamate--2,6-diaminopimelate ligase [unclassified Salinivibrio]|uniref:UDP-N-acetylmuramoyl-L-alanyl-D-glutamate--2, 6-diaminopimelate ligase n=1 Tax=unclassified Salinivibrio TaxID=2636825 RepID=UPI0009855646|nr:MULTISPECIES: UDP-N-acetylmuramoyl-L-alanyl-D-glutamate--2,6-diaminopimelate ligase [unclassified Salinivibrio]OOF13031.1 UDP-N-acetylmuramoyl-L-alanyl-D-glutamate--2,6-diaminopimelate ligase [Salinivibrio sp. PR919]OOF18537.1 UDP-N-acetylmuramoyl-L-alanyl-D-glutamate--2,6-diaminopimelate ligase [Salinivibrio sp. PR932]
MRMNDLKQWLSPWLADAPSITVNRLTLDSRQVTSGDVFVAIAGHQVDGRRFIPAAIEAGAVAIVQQADDAMARLDWHHEVPVISLPDLPTMLSALAARFYHDPQQRIGLIGVTGTNGKTTVSQLIAQWLDALNAPTAVMGTTGNGFIGRLQAAENTTGDAISIQAQLATFADQGAKHVAMEVSSHGLVQGRVASLAFDAAVFTNLSHDHLDYHGTLAAYAEAKKQLFSLGNPLKVINADDKVGRQWLREWPEAIAVALHADSLQHHVGPYVRATQIDFATDGVRVMVETSWGQGELNAALVGDFNVSNLLVSLATLLGLGYSLDALLATSDQLNAVIGRMEVFLAPDKPTMVVDYAHTPDALEKALIALRRHCRGKLWCVFGCGGDRDTRKRPVMARIAEQYADQAVLTNDNPRSEAPNAITDDMLAGMQAPDNAWVEHDRARALSRVMQAAKADDIVLVAGKGHEDYQVLADGKVHYSDRETVAALLKELP